MSLTKEQILAATDLPREEVQVPEWGGAVWVRTMTGAEKDSWEEWLYKNKGIAGVRGALLVRVLTDDGGARLFTDADAQLLGTKSSKALDRAFAVAKRMNGLSAEDVKELEKNSDGGRSDDSASV